MATRNRLRKIRLRELGLVDRPANQHSLSVLIKRDDSALTFRDTFREIRKMTAPKKTR